MFINRNGQYKTSTACRKQVRRWQLELKIEISFRCLMVKANLVDKHAMIMSNQGRNAAGLKLFLFLDINTEFLKLCIICRRKSQF